MLSSEIWKCILQYVKPCRNNGSLLLFPKMIMLVKTSRIRTQASNSTVNIISQWIMNIVRLYFTFDFILVAFALFFFFIPNFSIFYRRYLFFNDFFIFCFVFFIVILALTIVFVRFISRCVGLIFPTQNRSRDL